MHDSGIAGRIEAAGCLIDNQDAGKGEQFHSKADPLRLSSGEISDRRVVQVGNPDICLDAMDALRDLLLAQGGR